MSSCSCGNPTCRVNGGGFYVTAIDVDGMGKPSKVAWLLGPYETHAEALSNVERGRQLAHETRDPRAAFLAYGTSRTDVLRKVMFT